MHTRCLRPRGNQRHWGFQGTFDQITPETQIQS